MSETKLLIQGWKFKACDEQEWQPAVVPGCVHTDLLRNGKIPNPFYGTNEKEVQWIDKKDWEYTASFDVSDELLAETHLDLVFSGLDTYADVYVNGKHVLSADNMFRSWKVAVKGILQSVSNTLHIRFRSPVQEDLPKLEALGYALPATNDQSEVGGLGDKKISVFARKAPYHYGWDWGPRFVTSGIWREVRLEGWSGRRITDLYIRQNQVSNAAAQLTAVVEVESDFAGESTLRLSAEGDLSDKPVTLTKGVNVLELDVHLEQPKLWWCRGLGEAHLYTFRAQLLEEGRTAVEKSVRTGLRSMKLVREKDAAGTSFYIEVNGVPVFAKGANHIPNDSFVAEVTYERYKHEIVTAIDSNMNMLRVWGGGIYEQNAFYELCDEYGLLVWQDFMFACSMYPGDEAFLANVKAEAEENVKRLRNHPCIALWCGNNEMDTAWSHYDERAGWGWKQQYSPDIRERIWADYEAVFHRILPAAVEQFAHGTDYWPSSPMTGLTGDKTQHSHSSTTSGDIHYWGVWHAVEPFENYNVHIGRFMSEYGFQSFPEYRSVRTYAEKRDLALESEVMLAHQKNGRGNQLIKEYMDMYLPEPKDFPSFLYMSQVLQAEAMKTAIEAHRRRKPFCMGSLYWQMNDCWPVASWAGMDYYGRWKALQYYAKRSFQDVLLSIDGTSGNRVDFHIVSDVLAPVSGRLHISLYSFVGELLKEISVSAAVDANTAALVFSADSKDLLEGADPSSTVLYARLEHDGRMIDTQLYYFAAAKEIRLDQASIRVTQTEAESGMKITLETDVLAKQVWVDTDVEGSFSDNYFDLLPGIAKTIDFQARNAAVGNFGAAAGSGKVTVRSMADFLKRNG